MAYPHEYNAGYVGKSCNLKHRFYTHCGDTRSSVKQYCDKHGVRPRGTFEIYEIYEMQYR